MLLIRLSDSGKTARILTFNAIYKIVLGPINLPTARLLGILDHSPPYTRCGCSRKIIAHFQSPPNSKNATAFNITHLYTSLYFWYQLGRYIITNVFVHIFPTNVPIHLVLCSYACAKDFGTLHHPPPAFALNPSP